MASGPIIWSETRQELCESLPYYRAYQTGSYVASNLGRPPSTFLTKHDRKSAVLKDSIPYGYLLAGWPSRRDAWTHGGKVIVSHGGGKSEVEEASLSSLAAPKASLKQDQSSSDNTIRALLHSSRHRVPIVLIAADSYALLPFRLACSYAVLGWYLITDAWAERETATEDAGFVRWKFRFEWIPAQGERWWDLLREPSRMPWDPRQRIETFTKAQRQLVKHIRGKGKGKTEPDSASSSNQSSRASSVLPGVPKSTIPTKDDRDRLLYGPIDITAKLVSTASATYDAKAPCNLLNAATCLGCRSPSPIVYSVGWLCLQPDCHTFFLLASREHPDEDTLTFHPGFLQPQDIAVNDAFPSGQPPFSLIPARPSTRSMDQARGLWCRKCGRLSCREVIYQPRCSHCGHRVGKWKPLPVVPPPQLSRHPFDFSSDRRDGLVFDPIISPSSGIVLTVRKEDGLAIYTFTFPAMFGDCRVHLLQADVDDGAHESEADEIFTEFQRHTWPRNSEGETTAMDELRAKLADTPSERKCIETEPRDTSTLPSHNVPQETASTSSEQHPRIPFRRHVLKNHLGGLGRMLTQQFTCNYGVAYKHVVAMGTEALDATSPSVIMSTLDLLHARTRHAIPLSQEFNELYPVLYLEHQAMNFHDDGEPGLGPVVSSLSLGSTCRMKFRLKAKHQAQFEGVRARDRTVLDLPLRHGSVVVQDGHDLQKYFEHSVSPDGFRIAVTARRIDPEENDKGTSRRDTARRSGDDGVRKRRTSSAGAEAKRRKASSSKPAPPIMQEEAPTTAARMLSLASSILPAARAFNLAPADPPPAATSTWAPTGPTSFLTAIQTKVQAKLRQSSAEARSREGSAVEAATQIAAQSAPQPKGRTYRTIDEGSKVAKRRKKSASVVKDRLPSIPRLPKPLSDHDPHPSSR